MTDRALRFAMITTFYPPFHFGGDGQAVRRLAHALARRGHEVEVIHDVDAYRMLSKGPEPTPAAEPPGVRVHGLRSSLGSLSCLATQQLGRPVVHGRKIQSILRRGFDVIHFHNISLIGGPGILGYGRGLKIYTAHEHWLVCPSHILWRHNREVCDGRECLRCVLRHGRPPQLWRGSSLLAKESRHVDAFISLSQFSADKHREFGFGRQFSLMRPFLPETEGEGSDDGASKASTGERPYFLFVGRLEAIKGLQDVIPHFDDSSPAELWIAGSGNYENDLKALAKGRSRVRFLGLKSPGELRNLYRNAVALVIPSLCYEVFPMVVLEAFREGTPIVARRLGPFPEIVAESNAGILFETPEEMRSAFRRLAEDSQFRAVLGLSGRNAYERLWHEDIVMNDYFTLIARLARDRGGEDEILRKLSGTNAGRVVSPV